MHTKLSDPLEKKLTNGSSNSYPSKSQDLTSSSYPSKSQDLTSSSYVKDVAMSSSSYSTTAAFRKQQASYIFSQKCTLSNLIVLYTVSLYKHF